MTTTSVEMISDLNVNLLNMEEIRALLEIERAKNKDLEEKLAKNIQMQQEMRHYHNCLYQNLEEV